MGRTHVFFTLALILALSSLLAGCGSSSPSGPGGSVSRSYGPPFNPIAFVDSEGYLATVFSNAQTTDPLYVRGIGPGKAVTDPAFGFQVRPETSPDDADFAVYDLDSEKLYVIDKNGDETGTYFDEDSALEGMFSFSSGGSRMVYVSGTQQNQKLMLAGVTASTDLETVVTLDATQMFFGRPAVDITVGGTRISMMVDENETTKIITYNRNGDVLTSLTTPVQALAISPDGDQLAWVDASNQHELVIYNAGLTTEQHRVDFSNYGNGVAALSWSPDNSMIAFFAGSAGQTGKLCLYDLSSENLRQIQFDNTYTYEFPFGTDKLWAQPSWNTTSSQLAFTVVSDEDVYVIVAVDLIGNLFILYEDVGSTRYVQWMDES